MNQIDNNNQQQVRDEEAWGTASENYPSKDRETTDSEYKTGGKYIGGKLYSEEEIEEYRSQMKGRRLFFSNLGYEVTWKHVKDHMRQAGDVVRVDIF